MIAWAAALGLLAHAGWLVAFDLAADLGWFFGCAAAGFGALWLAGRSGDSALVTPQVVLGVALGLRILLLPLPPSLSDDVLRYVWDGRVLSSSFNPYAFAPEDVELAPLRDELWESMPHKEVPTVYPPLAIGAFSIAAWAPNPILAWKILLVLLDMGSCWWVVLLCRRFGVSLVRSTWYAWNPLVTLEVAGMGHVDGLGVFFVLAAVVALGGGRKATSGTKPRWLWASLAATAAVLAKLVPLALIPIWTLISRRPVRFAATALAFLVLGLLPVVWSVGGVPPGMLTYGVSWEFNGPLYEPLWRGLDALETPAFVEQQLDDVKLRTEEHEFWNRFYPYNYSRLHAKLLLVGLLGLLWTVCLWRVREPLAVSGWVFVLVVLCSATVYPWYLLWIMPWAAVHERWEWRAMSATVLLAYVPQFSSAVYFPWFFLLIWAPWLLWLVSKVVPLGPIGRSSATGGAK